jgi:hypothetical protein
MLPMALLCRSMPHTINKLLMDFEMKLHTEAARYLLNGCSKSRTMFIRSIRFPNKTMQKPIQTAFMTALAATFDAPVRRINHRDPNVGNRQGATVDKTFQESIRFRWKGLPTEIRFNGSLAVLESKIDFNAGVWSINYPDRIMMTRQPQTEPTMVERWPLFVTGPFSSRAYTIWHSRSFRDLLNGLALGKNESLHFYRNAVTLYVEASDIPTFTQRAETLLAFLQRYAPTEIKSYRIVQIPAAFKDLRDIAQAWAISDDITRSEMVENSSTEDLRRLVGCVMPRISEINEYLSVHFDEESAALGALAEAASEAKLRLDQTRH